MTLNSQLARTNELLFATRSSKTPAAAKTERAARTATELGYHVTDQELQKSKKELFQKLISRKRAKENNILLFD